MNFITKYLKGWSFRTNRPTFDSGQEITAVITGVDGNGVAIARIGDSKLQVENAPKTAIDARARLKVTTFDDAESTGTAEFLDVVGEGTF